MKSSSKTVHCLLSRAARLWPKAPALIDAAASATLSFQALDERVQALSQRLDGPDSNAIAQRLVLLECHTRVIDLILILAIIRAGWVCVPVSFRSTDRQLQALVCELQPALLITERHLVAACTVIDPTCLASGTARRQTPDWQEFAADRPVTGLFTSGSSGQPKLALHSYSAHQASADASRQLLPLQPGDRNLMSLPLFHIGGLAPLFRNLLAGSTMICGGRADDAEFLMQHGISHLSFVSTQLRALLQQQKQQKHQKQHPNQHPNQHPKQQARTFRIPYALVGGGPIEPALVLQARRAGIDCWQTYGLTEMASQVATGTPDGRWQILPGNDLRLDAAGAIEVRGATRLIGYWRNGRLDRSCFSRSGWFATQDLGRWHDGQLSIQGRRDNLFISGGENIQPEEIEHHLLEHPAIERVLVCSLPEANFGRRPIALIGLQAGNSVSENELRLWLEARLPRFKIPQQWWQMPERPEFMGTGLKINRARVQAWVEQQPQPLKPFR
ncbi:AMP-binding protein [Reinekea sp.]|uniref:AMP-binding protein n=1 Tax=Reinekea sp. TaxID=1970455 RepID=UPI002A82F31F|nr:AMP-binding protein [Reinekea sp.]